jgi:hypothetical protein
MLDDARARPSEGSSPAQGRSKMTGSSRAVPGGRALGRDRKSAHAPTEALTTAHAAHAIASVMIQDAAFETR